MRNLNKLVRFDFRITKSKRIFTAVMEKEKISGRGGRRPGAGRPKTGVRMYSFRADRQTAAVIEAHADKTGFIRECILEHAGSGIAEMYPATSVKDIVLPWYDIDVVAGFPVPLDNDEKAQDIELLSLLCPHPESCYLIRVRGNSMIDAGICSDDIVIVDKSNRNPTESQIAVCELNGEYTLKHFVMRGGEGWLVPDNPDFPEIRISRDDDFSVWGTVTYVIHKPRS